MTANRAPALVWVLLLVDLAAIVLLLLPPFSYGPVATALRVGFAIATAVVAISLWRHRRWARIGQIVVGALQMGVFFVEHKTYPLVAAAAACSLLVVALSLTQTVRQWTRPA